MPGAWYTQMAHGGQRAAMRPDATITFFMKLFKTASIDVVKDCQSYFAIDLPNCDLKRRQDKFILRYSCTVNGFCQFCNKL